MTKPTEPTLKRGRPALPADQVGRRYQVYLRPVVAAAVSARGQGSLSRGIAALVSDAPAPDLAKGRP